MRDDSILDALHTAAEAVQSALGGIDDWGLAGTAKVGQYKSDLAADEAAVRELLAAGFGVLSEESGLHQAGRDIVVVVDPLDGSTNASHKLSWFATSLCAVDADGARAALVVDLMHGTMFSAIRGAGATRDGEVIQTSGRLHLGEAIVGVSGLPNHHYGWGQFRALGAAALDLCAVACGQLDAYVDCNVDAHGPWDYLGGMLVCQEAGAAVADVFGRDLLVLAHDARRDPLAAATPELHDELLHARLLGADWPPTP